MNKRTNMMATFIMIINKPADLSLYTSVKQIGFIYTKNIVKFYCFS